MVPKSVIHPQMQKFIATCALIAALKNTLLPPLPPSPEGQHHCPVEVVEEYHESGDGGNGHDMRVHIMAE